VPGELAPKLALALSCETSGEYASSGVQNRAVS